MSLCSNAMDYFALDEMDAADVIDYICLMQDKGRRISEAAALPEKKETKRRVYADQANWY